MSSGAILNQDKPVKPEDIEAGTLGNQLVANATAVSNLNIKQVRNIYAGTIDIGVGAALTTGDIYLVYE